MLIDLRLSPNKKKRVTMFSAGAPKMIFASQCSTGVPGG